MADGLNQARAVRVAELMNDYRTLLIHISQQQASPPSSAESQELGYTVLRECHQATQRLLAANYHPSPVAGNGDAETEKAELQRVIIDSSARRFQAHKIYLRAAAAQRWIIARSNILRGQAPSPALQPALKGIQATLQNELARITDRYIVADLRAADVRAGHWLGDDPSLETILRYLQRR